MEVATYTVTQACWYVAVMVMGTVRSVFHKNRFSVFTMVKVVETLAGEPGPRRT